MTDKVKIKLTKHSSGSQIFINDVELKNVVGLIVTASVDERSEVIVGFLPDEIEIEGESQFIRAEDENQIAMDLTP